MDKVKEVLRRLRAAGLNLDLKKCDFAVTQTRYLGYLVMAGQGVRADPEKIAAIKKWEAPTTLKGVRGFLGFANFYRDFIKDFSAVADPLVALTKKDAPYVWSASSVRFRTIKDSVRSGTGPRAMGPRSGHSRRDGLLGVRTRWVLVAVRRGRGPPTSRLPLSTTIAGRAELYNPR